jgi:tyrosine-protein kinase
MSDQQEFRQYVALFLRWWWLIAICAALGGGVTYAYSSRITPIYSASTTLLVQQASAGGSSEYTALLISERLARTYAEMITSRAVMEAVIAQLGLDQTSAALASRIKVELVRDTQLIRLQVEDTNPLRAAQISDAVAYAFAAQNDLRQQDRFADSLTSTRQQMQEMSALIENTTAAIASSGAPISEQEYAALARQETALAGYRNTYAMMSSSYEQMRLTAAQSADSVVIAELAEIEYVPIRPRTMQSMTLAAVVGAMLAAGVIFLVEYLDDTLKTPDDVRATLGLHTLGAIGKMGRRGKELVVADDARSPISEAYRALRTNVRMSSLDGPLATLLVTSPGTSEGKSVTVANLAVVMTQSGLKVAIVDADMRRPRQHRIFSLEQGQGLTESLLAGRVDGNLHLSEHVDGLCVLPSGELPPNPAELLGSRRMEDLLSELAGLVDLAIIDSPPLLPVTDAAVLAQRVDGVLLVLQAGVTRRAEAEHAVERLRQVNANVLGVVLNAVPMRKGGHYYYYYYHRYYDDGRERRRRKTGILAALRRRKKSAHPPAEPRPSEDYVQILQSPSEDRPVRTRRRASAGRRETPDLNDLFYQPDRAPPPDAG